MILSKKRREIKTGAVLFLTTAVVAGCASDEHMGNLTSAQRDPTIAVVRVEYPISLERKEWNLDFTRGRTITQGESYDAETISTAAAGALVSFGVVIGQDATGAKVVLDLDSPRLVKAGEHLYPLEEETLAYHYVATELAACPTWKPLNTHGDVTLNWEPYALGTRTNVRYPILLTRADYTLLLADNVPVLISTACIRTKAARNGEAYLPCDAVSPLSEDAYPDTLIRGHFQASLGDEYRRHVRQAARVATETLWEASRLTEPLTDADVMGMLHAMYCNYTGGYIPPDLSRDQPQVTQFHQVDGHWYEDVRRVLLASEPSIDIESGRIFAQSNSKSYATHYVLAADAGFEALINPVTTFMQTTINPTGFQGYSFAPPAAFDDFLEHITQHINLLRGMLLEAEQLRAQGTSVSTTDLSVFVDKAQTAIASLAFAAASWHPFSKHNWGVLYIVIAQARRLLLQGLSPIPIDRMANALDLLLSLGAYDHPQAKAIYLRWHEGSLDPWINSDLGLTLRRYADVGTPPWYFERLYSLASSFSLYELPAHQWPENWTTWTTLRESNPEMARVLHHGLPTEGVWLSLCWGNALGQFEVRMLAKDMATSLQQHSDDYSYFFDSDQEQFCGLAEIEFRDGKPIRIDDMAENHMLARILDDEQYFGRGISFFGTLFQLLAPAYNTP